MRTEFSTNYTDFSDWFRVASRTGGLATRSVERAQVHQGRAGLWCPCMYLYVSFVLTSALATQISPIILAMWAKSNSANSVSSSDTAAGATSMKVAWIPTLIGGTLARVLEK